MRRRQVWGALPGFARRCCRLVQVWGALPGFARRCCRLVPSVVALGACLLLPASAAAAGIRIRGVDTSDYPRVRVTIVTSTPTSTPPQVRENGKAVHVVSAENLSHAANVELLIDTSRSMRGASLDNAIAAARQFLVSKPH